MAKDYESNKKSIERYFEKCTRIQFMLNPDIERDAKIIEYLKEIDNGKPVGRQIKELIYQHMEMEKLLRKSFRDRQ